jgi:hypothetical protein
MLFKFWDEAFLTAVFLINRLPSRVINNETPYERLFVKHQIILSLGRLVVPCGQTYDPTTPRSFHSDPNAVCSLDIVIVIKGSNVWIPQRACVCFQVCGV